MREETIMASVVKHAADLMQENHKLKADLKTAHEMIRELREALEWYSETGKPGQFTIVDDKRQFIDDFANWGKRAREVLSKQAEFLKKMEVNNDR
jgi:hypothetical protein